MMIHFRLKKKSKIKRDILFSISIDIENFSKIMPKHFKSLKIQKRLKNEILVDEKIYFLNVQVKHIILRPDVHEVHILSGMMRGTMFVEHYFETNGGTDIAIDVSIKLNGIAKMFLPFGFILKRHMSNVMEEFLALSEKFIENADK